MPKKTIQNIIYILFETDDTHGNKGVCNVFDSKEKAEEAKKKRCGNDKFCSLEIQEWLVE